MESISVRFRRDHRGLLKRFDELTNAVEGADPGTIAAVWTDFERAVERHLTAEEKQILPRLERKHPAEVKAIRHEHHEIRRLLADLGVRADLRTLRSDVAAELVRKLEEHAMREESGIYAWADQELSPHHRSILRMLDDVASRVY